MSKSNLIDIFILILLHLCDFFNFYCNSSCNAFYDNAWCWCQQNSSQKTRRCHACRSLLFKTFIMSIWLKMIKSLNCCSFFKVNFCKISSFLLKQYEILDLILVNFIEFELFIVLLILIDITFVRFRICAISWSFKKFLVEIFMWFFLENILFRAFVEIIIRFVFENVFDALYQKRNDRVLSIWLEYEKSILFWEFRQAAQTCSFVLMFLICRYCYE